MRTTLDLNDELLAEAKAQAAREQISFKALVERGLRQALGSPAPRLARKRPALPLFTGGHGSRVDLTNNETIRDTMDAES